MRLVADIGGTNSRLALAEAGQLRPTSIRSFRNAHFTSFDTVIDAYLETIDEPAPTEFAVAVAGPVDIDTARLTNRDWQISSSHLAARLGAQRGGVINDLVALGYAVPRLGPEHLHTIIQGVPECGAANQALVVGIGTGFNVSPVMRHGNTVICLRAEFGHTALPASICHAMETRQTGLSASFPTVEHCFSGRGFAALCNQISGRRALDPEAIIQRVDEKNPAITDAVEFYAELIGWLYRELMLAYLPTNGLYFAGSVARSILTGPCCTRFQKTITAPYPVSIHEHTPTFAITADAAALHGCARMPLLQDSFAAP